MRIVAAGNRSAITALCARDLTRDPAVMATTARIVSDVRVRGDEALRHWMKRLDAIDPPFEIAPKDVRAGWAATPRDVRDAIRLAARHLERVAGRQLPKPFTVNVAPGVRVEQRIAPLSSVGCYVPGGRYPLPSTLLMTVVPAVVAGVQNIVVACPKPTPVVLCAALEAGATRVLRIGGAQAIAALAYGTASIRRVDKIVGPGNAWVAAAKTLISSDCAIDFQAGPSEIVVYSDTGRADWIAADLLAQAEHDPAARAIFITTKKALASEVAAQVMARMPHDGPAASAIAANGAIVVARNRQEATDLVNRIAPEHLVCDRIEDVARFRTAGTIFVGPWSVQASGDYCTGSNHVLPTGGAARFRGGLNASDFVRVYAVQTLTPRGLKAIGPSVMTLAKAEGLTAHADSIALRLSEEIRATRHR